MISTTQVKRILSFLSYFSFKSLILYICSYHCFVYIYINISVKEEPCLFTVIFYAWVLHRVLDNIHMLVHHQTLYQSKRSYILRLIMSKIWVVPLIRISNAALNISDFKPSHLMLISKIGTPVHIRLAFLFF